MNFHLISWVSREEKGKKNPYFCSALIIFPARGRVERLIGFVSLSYRLLLGFRAPFKSGFLDQSGLLGEEEATLSIFSWKQIDICKVFEA